MLTNDRKYTLDSPCPTGIFGVDNCSEDDYKSWRRVAVAIRSTLLSGDYSDHLDLFPLVQGWLAEWVVPVGECPLGKWIAAATRARSIANPDFDRGCARFPPTLRFWDLRGAASGWTYNEQVVAMVSHIREGYGLAVEALESGAVTELDATLERAKVRKPPTVPTGPWQYILAGGIFIALSAFGVWAYSTVALARRRPQ